MFRLFPIRVSFPLTEIPDKDVSTLTVLRHEYRMDTARLLLEVDYDELNQYVSAGSPLRIRWGGDRRFDEFVGYVHSFRPEIDGIKKTTEIIAISAAYPMFNETGRTYTDVGIHNVAQQIGDDYRFQVETDPHPYIHEQILQRGDSDWTLLTRLAEQWGYIVLVDGVTLVFRPLEDVLQENYRYSTTARTRVSGSLDPRANILAFKESYSATGKSPLTGTGFYGVDPVNVTLVSQRESNVETPIFSEIDVHRSVTSDLEGELKTESVRASGQFPFEATATFRAPYRKKPFDCYRIFHDGRWKTWTIRSIKHVITGEDYISEVVLGSDGMDHSDKSRDGQLDINTLLKQNRRAKRPRPVIVNTRPYFIGAGASAVVPDQRWKAEVMTVPVNDSEEYKGYNPLTFLSSVIPDDVLTNASRWVAAGFGYDSTQPAPVAVSQGMSLAWTTDADTPALRGVFFDAVAGRSYKMSIGVVSRLGALRWRATVGWTRADRWITPDGYEQVGSLAWVAPETRPYLFGIETFGPNTDTYTVTSIRVEELRTS